MSHLTNLSVRDRELLLNRPSFNFRLPDKRIGTQPAKAEEQTIEQRSARVADIINSYKHIETLSALAQAKIDHRSKNFAIPLDPKVDQSVIASMRRAFPGENPARITHDQYRRSLEYLSASALTQSKKYTWTKEDRLKKKQSGEILTNIWKDRMKPGGLRPELEHEVIPQLDMDQHQKNLVLILFEQMVPLFVDLIQSILDPLFSSEGPAPGELNDTNLDIPTKLAGLQEQISSKATEMVQNRDKNKLTSAFSIPQLSLVEESVSNQGLNPISVADAALVSQTYERGAYYTLDAGSTLPPLSRILHGNKVMSRAAVDTLTMQHMQTSTEPVRGERQFVEQGLPPEDQVNVQETTVDSIVRAREQARIDLGGSFQDFSDAALIDTFDRTKPDDFVNFLDDQVQRSARKQSETIDAEGVFNGMQFSNTFTKSGQDGRDFLADCIPCADRILDILEFQPGRAVLDIFANDIKHRLDGLNAIGDLLADDSFRSEFCALIRFLSFMCIPDIQAIIIALISLVMSLLTSPLGLVGLLDFFLTLITPLFTPILSGLSALMEQLTQLVLAPLVCVMDAFNAQLAKLNTGGIFDLQKIESDTARAFAGEHVSTAQAGLSRGSSVLSGVPEKVGEVTQEGVDFVNQLSVSLNKWIGEAHANLLRKTEELRENFEKMLSGWANNEDQFLLQAQQLMQLKRLIGLLIFVADTTDGNPVCRDPFAEGSVAAAGKEIAERVFSGWTVAVDENDGSIRFQEDPFDLPENLQPYRGSPESGGPQRSQFKTEFDSLIEFAGDDLFKKLSEPTDVTLPLSPLCGGKTTGKHIDTINSIIRDLNRATI